MPPRVLLPLLHLLFPNLCYSFHIRYTKYGTPTSDTAIPAGISIGENKFLATVSAKISMTAAIKDARSSDTRCPFPTTFLLHAAQAVR